MAGPQAANEADRTACASSQLTPQPVTSRRSSIRESLGTPRAPVGPGARTAGRRALIWCPLPVSSAASLMVWAAGSGRAPWLAGVAGRAAAWAWCAFRLGGAPWSGGSAEVNVADAGGSDAQGAAGGVSEAAEHVEGGQAAAAFDAGDRGLGGAHPPGQFSLGQAGRVRSVQASSASWPARVAVA